MGNKTSYSAIYIFLSLASLSQLTEAKIIHVADKSGLDQVLLSCEGVRTNKKLETKGGGYQEGYVPSTTTIETKEDYAPDSYLVNVGEEWIKRSGGKNRKISKLSISEDEIAGQFKTNPFIKSSFLISRILGEVKISGPMYSFSGDCEAIDISTKKF